ncbi:YdcF family protein [Alkalihalobacillus sp. LMS6]|uniref:YdcF family protein n=1 Tax=Bacillaceae TaxID=186817 RepID=UPI000C07FC01|nr:MULTISPECIES: YdcF family protein [Bacillaceae]UTR07417.1 YdcF family protein [Alkalihalobacillus sp. LMS6]
MNIFLLSAIICAIVFFFSMRIEKRSIFNGMFLTASLLLFLAGGIAAATTGPMSRIDYVILILSALFALMSVLFLLFVVGYIIRNTWKLVKKEGRKWNNFFSLSISLFVMVLLILIPTALFTIEPLALTTTVYIGLYGFLFLSFLISSVLYRQIRPHYDQDYLLILGAGLLKGERVSPILASRLDRGVYFYHMQKNVAAPPKIIVSGGRGEDELISEAEAMKAYLIKKNIPPQQIILEDRARNTYENFLFSKKLMEQSKSLKLVFITNHFHVFRSSLLAKQLAMPAEGIGSPTAWYFQPNAYTREFIGVLYMNKKSHLAFFILYILVSVYFYLR